MNSNTKIDIADVVAHTAVIYVGAVVPTNYIFKHYVGADIRRGIGLRQALKGCSPARAATGYAVAIPLVIGATAAAYKVSDAVGRKVREKLRARRAAKRG